MELPQEVEENRIVDAIIAKKPELKDLKDALIDLTQLTITTKGDANKEIRTTIKLTGDVESTTTLKGDQLATYHEKMANLSINIMRTYAQIFIQLISVFIPLAGVKIPDEVIKSIADLIKTGFSLESA